jgi:hypothetical protein
MSLIKGYRMNVRTITVMAQTFLVSLARNPRFFGVLSRFASFIATKWPNTGKPLISKGFLLVEANHYFFDVEAILL